MTALDDLRLLQERVREIGKEFHTKVQDMTWVLDDDPESPFYGTNALQAMFEITADAIKTEADHKSDLLRDEFDAMMEGIEVSENEEGDPVVQDIVDPWEEKQAIRRAEAIKRLQEWDEDD